MISFENRKHESKVYKVVRKKIETSGTRTLTVTKG